VRHFLPLLFLWVFASSLAAQTNYFVDPTLGSDANDGLSESTAFQSLTHALSIAVAGDHVELLTGNYAPGSNEIFPIVLKDQVDVEAGVVQLPVFQPPAGGVVFQVPASGITGATLLAGIRVTGGTVGLEIPSTSAAVNGLTVEDSLFEMFSSAGVDARLASGSESFTLRNCVFTGSGGLEIGVHISVRSGASLNGGSVEDCHVSSVAQGINVEAADGGTVSANFFLLRNLIDTYTQHGILISATAGTSGSTTNTCIVQGNQVNGSGGNEDGLRVEAHAAAAGSQVVVCNGAIGYNTFFLNHSNAVFWTDNDGSDEVDITCVVLGNFFQDASFAGILVDQDLPAVLMPNNSPDLGDLTKGSDRGRNTFLPGSANFDLILDGLGDHVLPVERNFWNQTSLGAILARIQLLNSSLNPQVTTFLVTNGTARATTKSIAPRKSTKVKILAGPQFAFLDNPDPQASTGRIDVKVGTTKVAAAVAANGTALTFTSPSLPKGNAVVTITLPAGGNAQALLKVVAPPKPSGGGCGGVATSGSGGVPPDGGDALSLLLVAGVWFGIRRRRRS